MEPKLWCDHDVLNYIDNTTCINIIISVLSGTQQIIHDHQYVVIIDDNGLKMVMVQNNKFITHKIQCSHKWLDCMLVLNNVDGEVIKNIEHIIYDTHDVFNKFSLIVQVLMSYSGVRDINRILLKTFFDNCEFEGFYDVYTVINSHMSGVVGVWERCCSYYYGYVEKYHKACFHDNIIIKLCDVIRNDPHNGTIDNIDLQILYCTSYTLIIISESGHNSFMMYHDGHVDKRKSLESIDYYVIEILHHIEGYLNRESIKNDEVIQKMVDYVIYDIWSGERIVITKDNISKYVLT